jgi:hypothetical protein
MLSPTVSRFRDCDGVPRKRLRGRSLMHGQISLADLPAGAEADVEP